MAEGNRNGRVPLVRLHFVEASADDLQGFASVLIDVARINNALRLLDKNSESYSPATLWSKAFFLNHPQGYIVPEDRLYISKAGKQSPLWVDVASVVGSAAAVWAALIATAVLREGRRSRVEERRWRVYEVLRRHLGATKSEAQQATRQVKRSMYAIGDAGTPIGRVELHRFPIVTGIPDATDIMQELEEPDDDG